MIRKTNTIYRLNMNSIPFSRFRLSLLFLIFCFFSCLSFSAFGGGESPEVIEEIRTSLRLQAAQSKQKTNTAKKVGVANGTLDKFIKNDPTLSKSSFDKIIENFKKEYHEEYNKITSTSSSAFSQTSAAKSEQSSQPEPIKAYPCLDLCQLPFHPSFPDTYSLFMVDSSLISQATISDWEQHAHFADIGRRFLRPCLAGDENISFAITEQEAQTKNQWILQDQKMISGPNGEQKPYHVVQLFKKRAELKPVNLIKALTEHHINAYDGFDFQAGLIIFPYTDHTAMVYGLSQWKTLLNPDCIIPQWGLRVATSGQICNPNQIKALHADHYRTANPFSRREKAAALQPVEVFGLEVGSEELKTIALMPNKSVKTQHVIEGTDHLQFTVSPSDKVPSEQTLPSLHTISTYFFTLTIDPNFHVHSRMREFIDDEVKDVTLLMNLNQLLENLLKSPEGRERVFLHDTLWGEMKNKKLMFGDDKKHSIFEVFGQLSQTDPFPQTLNIWTPRRKTPKEFDIRRIFHSLPLDYEGKFYRFDRTHWYQVDDSRFEGIKRILRSTKKSSATLHLPDYSVEDTQRSTERKKADYKEAKYNLRAVQEIKKKAGWEAVLLDRINVSLGGADHKFEFADLLVMQGNAFHIVHVKRAKASQLSHHREQVERSADFLATELTKKNAHILFHQGIINGLYEANNLPIKKEKKQGTRITKGQLFLDYYASLKSQDFLSALSIAPISDQPLLSFRQQVLPIIDKDFFKSYPLELVSALDALYDCTWYKQAFLPNTEIEEFLNAVKQGIIARQFLFPNGSLKKSDLKNIKIILAVVDDRAIEATLKGKKQNAQRPIFKNQDLWGLDRTRAMVEKTGLGFTLMVINETATETWDAFGPIIKKERKENFMNMSGDEPELSSASYPIKTEPFLRFVKFSPFPPQRDLKSLFSTTQVLSTDLNENIVQKLQYTAENQTTYELFTCLTVPDGDCFFHSAFTAPGETRQVVQGKAANMRKQLCDAIQQGQYVDDLRPLVYEHYMGLLGNNNDHLDVPDNIKQYLQSKNSYTTMYNNMQHFGISIETIPNPEDRFPVDGIKALITEAHIKSYMERLRSVGGDDTYVPFRKDMLCPADILAILGQKRINIFTFNTTEKKLQLYKTAGTVGPCINLLHTGSHFERLYYPLEGDNPLLQCEQILTNYYTFIGN